MGSHPARASSSVRDGPDELTSYTLPYADGRSLYRAVVIPLLFDMWTVGDRFRHRMPPAAARRSRKIFLGGNTA